MKDYSKLADLNDRDKQNIHMFPTKNSKTISDDPFITSPSKTKDLSIERPKLATIHEQPAFFKSKSTTEIPTSVTSFSEKLDDQFKVKSVNIHMTDDRSLSNLSEIGLNLRNENLNSMVNCHQNLDKSFFQEQDDPFINKPPIDFQHCKTKKRRYKQMKELAVDVRNVSYQYGLGRSATTVLNDITLRVPLGGIYGLLGPSGCGKTTLLKIVCGLNTPSQGLVRVFNQAPGNHRNAFIPGPGVGYMPQDISLFQDLSVVETLVFYSKIYYMESHLVLPRIEFLLKLLHLEHKSERLINQLSGGQKRRVSLACALVHSPPLVILDEPTVGVDPLLRQKIWRYLVRLAEETALTVIITTHYIEEARQAKTVGLMRFGRMLVEADPAKLMLKYKQENLEDVFLSLCMLDEKEFKQSESESESGVEDEEDDSYKSQIKFKDNCVSYSVTPKSSSNVSNQTKEDVPKVVVSDYSLPMSPHVVREKENGNFDQREKFDEMQIESTQMPIEATNEIKQIRTPLSPINLNDNKIDEHLQVVSGRDRSDTCSSLGSSIIEYDSMSSKDSEQTPIKLVNFKREFKSTFGAKKSVVKKFSLSVRKISALFYKNITLLLRNVPLLLFQFLLPSIEIILFGICIGADPFDLPIAIFNQDTSGNLPQRFLESIDNTTIKQVQYPTLRLAIDAVQNGEAWGAIAFKQNFSTSLAERHLIGLGAENDTLKHSSIYVFLDMTNQLIGYKLQRTFLESFQHFSKQILMEVDGNPASVDLPIKIGKPIYGDKEPTFTEFMAPGVVLTIAFLATVALTALAFVMERKDGIMERILVSGVTPLEFLMSHIVTQLCVIVVQVTLLLIFTFLVFDIPSRGPFIWVILLTLAQAICGMEYGLLISSLCKSETAATMMALGSFYPNLLLSGTVWPTQAMPRYMRYFSYILPQTLPIESMRYILSRGWNPFDHQEVAIGFVITWIWTILFMIATLIAFRRLH